MAVAGGLNSQLGLKAETTPGSGVTVDRFYEFGNESLKFEQERIKYMGLRPTRRSLGSNNYVLGKKNVSGDIEMAVMSKGFGLIFKHCLGAVATTTPGGATNTRDHECTEGALDGLAWTIQVGRTDNSGTTQPFTYSGCKVASWRLANDTSGMLMLTLSIDGMDEDTDTSLASASYPSGILPFSYLTGAVTVNGSAFEVTEFDVGSENSLAGERHFISSTNPGRKREQLEGAGMREYTGNLAAEFESLTAYELFKDDTQVAVTMTYVSDVAIEGTFFPTVTVDIPCVGFTGETPSVGGPELLTQSLPFEILNDGTANSPISITVRNADTTA